MKKFLLFKNNAVDEKGYGIGICIGRNDDFFLKLADLVLAVENNFYLIGISGLNELLRIIRCGAAAGRLHLRNQQWRFSGVDKFKIVRYFLPLNEFSEIMSCCLKRNLRQFIF